MIAGEIRLKPIGLVRTEVRDEEVRHREGISQLIFDECLTSALEGLEGFSHLFVLYWMHRVKEEDKVLKARPRERLDMPLLGVLATRSPHRPNPIGLTVVQLLERKANVLWVRGLDAFNGTPIIDIKPYDSWDMRPDARMPEWWLRLEAERSKPV